MQTKVYIYGFLGADENFRVARFGWVDDDPRYLFIAIKDEAMILLGEYPSIRELYAMPATGKLRGAYLDAFRKNSMEGWVEFKDLCERDGLKITVD